MKKKGEGVYFPPLFDLSFLMQSRYNSFENFGDVRTSMLLLLCILKVFQVLFRVKQIFKIIAQKSASRLDSYEWQGV